MVGEVVSGRISGFYTVLNWLAHRHYCNYEPRNESWRTADINTVHLNEPTLMEMPVAIELTIILDQRDTFLDKLNDNSRSRTLFAKLDSYSAQNPSFL
jgi:hypothetical protein